MVPPTGLFQECVIFLSMENNSVASVECSVRPQLLGGSKAARTLSVPLGALIPLNWGVGSSHVRLALSSRRRKDLEKGGSLWPGAVAGGFLKGGSEGRSGGHSLAGDRKDDLPAGEGQAGIRSFGPRGRCWRVCSVILKHCSHSRACGKDPVFEREMGDRGGGWQGRTSVGGKFLFPTRTNSVSRREENSRLPLEGQLCGSICHHSYLILLQK